MLASIVSTVGAAAVVEVVAAVMAEMFSKADGLLGIG